MAAYYCVVNCYQYFLLILYGYAFQLLMCLFVFAYPSSYQRLFAVRCYHRSRSLMYGYDYRNYLCLHYAYVKAFPRQAVKQFCGIYTLKYTAECCYGLRFRRHCLLSYYVYDFHYCLLFYRTNSWNRRRQRFGRCLV